MRIAAIVVALLVLAALPRVAQPYYVTLVLPALAYGIALLGLNLLFGYTGLLSFGHALFVAVGAYAAAVLTSKLGVNVRWIYSSVFTLGTVLGTVGGALVVPTAAASLDMPVELVVEAFAVVVIGGLGSMRGALVGALVVGLMRALAIRYYAELEMLAIYLVVIVVLIVRPVGLFGKPVE